MKTFVIATATLLLSALQASGQQQAEPRTADYWSRDLKERITVNGFLQAGYTYVNLDGRNTNTLDVKRTLMWARGQVTDRWSVFLMHDFSSQLQEFYTDYRVTRGKGLTIRVGQFKNQLSLENVLSPALVELIDITGQAVAYYTGCGPDPLYGINYGRDLGIDLYGELCGGKLAYNVGLMNGRGVNARDKDNRKDVVVKLTYRPMPGLRVVASAQKGYGMSLVSSSVYIPEVNAIGVGQTYRRDRWTVGAEYKSGSNDYWKHRCVTLRGELLGGRDGRTHSYGGYLTACVPLAGCTDVVASYDYMNYAKGFDGKDRTQLFLGLQYWFFSKCRVQLQYTWADSWTLGLNDGWVDKSCHRLQLQTQVSF